MVERVEWALFRPYGPETPYITPLESKTGLVGTEFFHDWVKRAGAKLEGSPADAGILRTLDDVAGADFDPKLVRPNIARVFEAGKTQRYRAVSIAWGDAWAQLMHWVYNKAVARGMSQLSAPVDDGFLPTTIASHIDFITPKPGSWVPTFRAWTRTYERNGTVFYTAAAFPFRAEGPRGTQAYICCVLPLVHANIAVVFHPENLPDGGLRISTYREGSYCGGMYIVVPGEKRYSVVPAPMREHIDLRERQGHSGPYVEGKHQTFAFGARSYTLSYELRPSPIIGGPQPHIDP